MKSPINVLITIFFEFPCRAVCELNENIVKQTTIPAEASHRGLYLAANSTPTQPLSS